MPPKAGSKRKPAATSQTKLAIAQLAKRPKTESAATPADRWKEPHPFHEDSERHGIVLRKYYPHEMSNDRARAYRSELIPRPIETLTTALLNTATDRARVKVSKAVVHWFKRDLRLADNKALRLASERAHETGASLIAVYLLSPQDFEAHLTSPARVDFIVRNLAILKQRLAELDIPLHVETVERRRNVPDRMLQLLREWNASHIFANMEYEVDELRRDANMIRLLASNGISMDVVHDTCVVPPGELRSGSGKQYSVYTPWFRSWIRHIHENLDLLETYDEPSQNPAATRQKYAALFECEIPSTPANKTLPGDDAERYRQLWPAGEEDARRRLHDFCEDRITSYKTERNLPAEAATSSLSPYLTSGVLSARTCVRTARDRNTTKKLDGGNEGIQTWISEVAWRDFYRHVLVAAPYVW